VSKSLNEDATLTFAAADFSSKFTDPEGSSLSSIKILSLPTAGTLKNTGTNVVAGLVVTAGQIGQLTYSRAANENGDATFTVSGSDGDLSSEAAVVTLTVVPVNDAPSATIPTVTLVPVGTTLNPSLAGPLNFKSVAASAETPRSWRRWWTTDRCMFRPIPERTGRRVRACGTGTAWRSRPMVR
jgi:hypothetical protein